MMEFCIDVGCSATYETTWLQEIIYLVIQGIMVIGLLLCAVALRRKKND